MRDDLEINRPYELILADPPWKYSFSRSKSRQIENQYETMTVKDICALEVADVCADDCMLYLWATAPKLLEALRVMEAWGFKYKTQAVWDKGKIGMGYYFRGQHELLLVGKRGKPAVPAAGTRVSSVIREARGQHSAKPAIVYEMLERMYPNARKLELFVRGAGRAGWDVAGNQAIGGIEVRGMEPGHHRESAA